MVHRLLLLRHAKSSWDEPSLADHERPLAKRGRKAAVQVGEYLRAADLTPDLVVCSTARRTRQTWKRLALEGPEVRLEDAMYGATAGELAGHNPGMGDFAVRLCGAAVSTDARRLLEKFPTAALAVFETDGPWRQLVTGHTDLVAYRTPRDASS
jgi:phosphohistidine phosphatase